VTRSLLVLDSRTRVLLSFLAVLGFLDLAGAAARRAGFSLRTFGKEISR